MSETEDYLLGTLLGLKIALGGLTYRIIAQAKNPAEELEILNDVTHRLLAAEKLVASDEARVEKIRAIAEHTLDDVIGTISWHPGS
jgi:hypothetical protein